MALNTFSSLSFSCDLTKEYLEARSEYRLNIRQSYDSCRSSVSSAKFWFHFAQCEEQERVKNVAGGCAHIAGLPKDSIDELSIDSEHCEILKPNLEESSKLFENYITEMKIKKCET